MRCASRRTPPPAAGATDRPRSPRRRARAPASRCESKAWSLKLQYHRLVVRGAIVAVDADGAQARRELGRDEDEVAAVGCLPFLGLVHAERRRMGLARVQRLPGVHQAEIEDPAVQRVAGRQVEVAAQDRAQSLGLGAKRARLVDLPARGFAFEEDLPQAADLRGAVLAGAALDNRGE